MRRSLRSLFFVATVLVAVPVLADAPNGAVPPDRAAQYDAFVGTTSTIHDFFTDLTWERFAPRSLRTFAFAQSNCSSNFAGRLPTVKELLTIVDEDPHQVYDSTLGKTILKAVDQQAFGKYTYVDAPYWTSTPTGTAGEVWGVSFADGTMVRLQTASANAYVRCMR